MVGVWGAGEKGGASLQGLPKLADSSSSSSSSSREAPHPLDPQGQNFQAHSCRGLVEVNSAICSISPTLW